jgi:hypothetical protein
VDPCVQDLQGKAERVKPDELLNRLVDVFGEKAALRRRHEAVARIAGQYDVNNTYQYVIAREDQHLAWLAAAIRDMGGAVPGDASGPLDLQAVKGDEALRPVVLEDAVALDTFVEAWRPRTSAITHARHKRMVEVMLGEMQEQARLFHQAASGRVDLLGRRTGGARTPGSVLPTRWVE